MNAFRYLPFARRALQHSGPPLHLTVFVTGVCNARCRHCFHWKEVEEGVSGPSLESFVKLADSASRLGPLLWVSFGGGEPFLRKDLPEVAEAFGKHGLRHLAIPTNGLVEGRQDSSVSEILERCPETFLSVAVSFDGPPEIHDSIRQVPGGHARSMDAVRRLRAQAEAEKRLGVGIMLTVTQENQDTLADHMVELVQELKPDNVTINLARGTAMEEHLLNVDLARYDEVVATKDRLVREGRLPYFDYPLAKLAVARDRLMYERVAAEARQKGANHVPCTAGKLSAVVFENGSVQPCEMLGEELGNLNDVDWDLARLWQTSEANALRKQIKETRCSCTWECAQADNVLFTPKLWPGLAAGTLRG